MHVYMGMQTGSKEESGKKGSIYNAVLIHVLLFFTAKENF